MPNLIGIRGAVRVERNDAESISSATRELLREIQHRNELTPDAVVSGLFTMTPDLNADFPARAARELGWSDVALLGAQEAAIPGALDRVIRVLLHAWLDGPPQHVYMGDTAALRPDRAGPAPDGCVSGAARSGTALIVGLGLIGSSIGLALRRRGPFERLLGLDSDPAVAEQALHLGAVDAIAPSLEKAVEAVSVVLLCVPTDRIPGLVDQCGRMAEPDTLVLDTGSTKADVVQAMDVLPPTIRAVGTHPVAGSDRSGPGAARSNLFEGHRWILTHTKRTDERARETAETIVRATGAEPEWMDADTHDRSAVATIQLTYLLSAALASHLGGDKGPARSLIGPGARGMLRLARCEPTVMAGLLKPVWERSRGEVRGYIRALENIVEALDTAGSAERMADVLSERRQTGSSVSDPILGGPAMG